MKPAPSDRGTPRRDRIFLALVGLVLGGLAPMAVWPAATWLLAILAAVSLGLAALGADRTVARVASLFYGWP